LKRSGRWKSLEPAYYLNPGNLRGFETRENVSGHRNVWGKIFLETLFMGNFLFHGASSIRVQLFIVFSRLVFGARKRFSELIFAI